MTRGVSKNVAKGEYFFDTDPGFEAGTVFTINTPDSVISQQITAQIGTLAEGTHALYFRVKDNQNTWSHTQRTLVNVHRQGLVNDSLITGGQYFVNAPDPGFTNAAGSFSLPSPIHAGTFQLWIPYNVLVNGADTIYVRLRNGHGDWSHTVEKIAVSLQKLPFVTSSVAGPDSTLCAGLSSGIVKLDSLPESISPITYQWYKYNGLVTAPSGNNATVTGWTSIQGQTNATLASQPLSASTSFACYAISTAATGGGMWLTKSRKFTVPVVATLVISGAATQTVCEVSSLSLSVPSPPGTNTYLWSNNQTGLVFR